MAQQNILLKNGTVLIHDAENHIVPTQTDVLIQNGKIVKVAEGMEASTGVEVIDCTDKIVSPGFIDTHHHGWQTQLKGRHANELFLEYMITGGYACALYNPEDVFWGQLAGMLEAVAAGTTTVVDHAHVIMSPDHARLGISATATSGVRAVYCYGLMARPKSLMPLQMHENPLEDWIMPTFNKFADQAPFGDGRVTLGLAYDMWFLPQEVTRTIFDQVNEKNVRTITCHANPWLSITKAASSSGVLDERFLISHGGLFGTDDVELIKNAKAHVSSTPSTELQMSLGGRPLCFDASFAEGDDRQGVQEQASLGVDCHSNQSGSIISEARICLQDARMHFHENLASRGIMANKLPDSLSVEAVFNLATIKGAEAINMDADIGRIAEGYKADLVVFDALSPAMMCAAQQDPVAAIILHSSPADIELVMVDGIVRKRHGTLLPVTVDTSAQDVARTESLTWNEIAKETMKSRGRILPVLEQVDIDRGVATLKKSWHIDESVPGL